MRGYDMLHSMSELDDELIAEADGATRVQLDKFKKRWRKYYIGSMAAGLVCVCLAGVAVYQIRGGSTSSETADTAAAPEVAMVTAQDSNEEADAVESVAEETPLLEAGSADEECNLPTEAAMQDSAESVNSPAEQASTYWDGYTIIAQLTEGSGSTVCYKSPANGEHFSMLQLQSAIDQYEAMDGLFAYEVCIDIFSNQEKLDNLSEENAQQLEYLLEQGLDVWQEDDGQIMGVLTAGDITDFAGSADYGYMLHFVNEY